MVKRIVWSPDALEDLADARKTILDVSKSSTSANRLARGIFESTDLLLKQPEMYPAGARILSRSKVIMQYKAWIGWGW